MRGVLKKIGCYLEVLTASIISEQLFYRCEWQPLYTTERGRPSRYNEYLWFIIFIIVAFGCSVYDTSLMEAQNSTATKEGGKEQPNSTDTMSEEFSRTNDASMDVDDTDIEVADATDTDSIEGEEIRYETDDDGGCLDDACDFSHVEAVHCVKGSCRIEECETGYADCDEEIDNGCEIQTNSLDHCGGCEQPCEYDHASVSCQSHQCVLSQCKNGWLDCDGIQENGCEHREIEGPCPTLSLLYKPEAGDNKWIRAKIVILNHSKDAIPMTVVRLRYWYTADAVSPDQSFACWHPDEEEDCDIGFCCDNHIQYSIVPTYGTDADYYLELRFTGAPDIPARGEADHITVGVHKNSWEDYVFSNDYSYSPFDELTETEKITLHRTDVQNPEEPIWGIRPDETS